jgi:hypothetical protein
MIYFSLIDLRQKENRRKIKMPFKGGASIKTQTTRASGASRHDAGAAESSLNRHGRR